VKGIYIHIPFCSKKCIYCDFTVFDTNNRFLEELFKEYTDLVCVEIDLRFQEILNNKDFKTLYIGGGTPSFIGVENLLRILDKIFLYVPFSQFEEITIEANPEDVSLDFVKRIREIGISRVSLGIQSMSEKALEKLSRRNTPQVNRTALENLAKVGFDNINVDLIFDIPQVPLENVISSLDVVLQYDVVKHVSAYGLTVEEFTPLKLFVDRGIIKYDSSFEEQFIAIHEYLTSRGFRHYEISNYAIPGYESKHNLLYWRRQEYLGIGVSACGFVRREDSLEKRYQNVLSIKTYRDMLFRGELPVRYEEFLTRNEAFDELVMLGLRTSEGIDLDQVRSFVDDERYNIFLAKANNFISQGFFELCDRRLIPTLKGWIIHNFLVLELTS
jgi:oxygen-independent coproporphyrinogen-3 oxidase